MSQPPPGREDRPPGKTEPPKNLGGQNFLWLIDGPNSEGDWNARERQACRMTLRTLMRSVPLVWLVMIVRFVSLVPDDFNAFMWWGLVVGFLYRGSLWLYRFGGNQPTRKETRALILAVLIMNLWLATRFSSDERIAWLITTPTALVVTSLIAKNIASGMALWTTHVLSASAAERSKARDQWRRGRGTAGLGAIRRGQAVVVLAYLAAVRAYQLTDDGFLPWLSFLTVALGGWCVVCSAGRAPHHAAAATWRTIVLWASYNPPLPSGRTLLEPYTYQMRDPWVLLYDRGMSFRLGVLAVAVAVVTTVSAAGLPVTDEAYVFTLGDFVLDVARSLFAITIVPFLLFITVLFVIYGTALTDYWSRFAASAVAAAKRRSPT